MRALSGFLSAILLAGLAVLYLLPQIDQIVPLPTARQLAEDAVQRAADSVMLEGDFTLAVSWQPGFCETAPGKTECRTQTADRFDANHFVLHGLWPDPAGNTYCSVDQPLRSVDAASRWQELPEPEMAGSLLSRLETRMPGVASLLHRHEWIKHGTCAGASAETYFTVSMWLLDALNDTGVRTLFIRNIDKEITAAQIRDAFSMALGADVGRRVQVECETDGDRRLITELRLSLSGTIDRGMDLGKLMIVAPERSRGCPRGIVDRVGDQ